VVLKKQGTSIAEQIYREVVEVQERVLNKEHPSTLRTMGNLAVVLCEQGKYEKAEQIHQEVVGVRERVLGKEHPDTLTTMNNLAGVLGNQGKYGEAEQMYREVVIISEVPLCLPASMRESFVLGAVPLWKRRLLQQ
jgi:hypothetical protein